MPFPRIGMLAWEFVRGEWSVDCSVVYFLLNSPISHQSSLHVGGTQRTIVWQTECCSWMHWMQHPAVLQPWRPALPLNSQDSESGFLPWFHSASKASSFVAFLGTLCCVNITCSGFTYKTSFRWAWNLLFAGIPTAISKYSSQFYTFSLWHRLLFR